jgi:3-oxoacyl-[acyl-carrier protein] reductase
MADLTGKVAVVTGGSKGIGRAIARAMCERGADVALCSRHESEALRAAQELDSGGGGRALGIAADVRKPVDEIEPETWHRVIDTNLTGVYYCCREAVPELRKRGRGWIITIASLAGRYAFAGGTAYNASKFGLIGFTEALMLDLRDHGIRVSCVMPGSVNTHFNDREPSGESWKLAPDDVARAVTQLLAHEDRALPSRLELRPSQPKGK